MLKPASQSVRKTTSTQIIQVAHEGSDSSSQPLNRLHFGSFGMLPMTSAGHPMAEAEGCIILKTYLFASDTTEINKLKLKEEKTTAAGIPVPGSVDMHALT